MDEFSRLKKVYKLRKKEILSRLLDFRKLTNAPDEVIFEELCFCLLTPQSKAEVCAQVIADLKKEGLLLKGSPQDLEPFLKKARFYKKKAQYLILARNIFLKNNCIEIKNKIDRFNSVEARQWLVTNIKGLGYKEAGHFLRNIGLGEDLAILDIHILRRLVNLGVINEMPKSLSSKKYLEIEDKMRQFSRKIKIPLSHLDLLFWSMATGKVFK